MLKPLLAALFCAALAPGLHATPTRALTLDNQSMIIADDFDATIYYHLAAHFKNRLYADVLNSGKEVGWANLDVQLGTLVLWWNKDYNGKFLYDGLESGNRLGYRAADLNDNTGNAHAPLEGWIKEPQVKIGGGFAYELSDAVTLALCVQYGALNQTRDAASTDAAGAPSASGPASLSRYLTLGGGYYKDLTVTSYKNTQAATGLALAPSIGIATPNYTLDAKYEMLTNTLDNRHDEKVSDGSGTMDGSVTQGLKDKGNGSWLAMGKFRMPFKEGAFVLRGGYFNYDFSTQHTQKGSFTGSGFTAAELAGFDHVDAEENYTVKRWDAMLGWTQGVAQGRGMAVIGLGIASSSIRQEDISYTLDSSGPVNYNAIVRQSRSEALNDTLGVPLVIGGELEIAKFAKWSGSLSHNVYGTNNTSLTSESYNPAGGALLARSTAQGDSDLNSGWKFNTGLGLYFGSFTWDFALNDDFLASSGGLVNPAYQSSLSWGF